MNAVVPLLAHFVALFTKENENVLHS